MKKNYLLLVLLFAFTLVLSSCKKDDDPAPSPILGTWELDRVLLSGFPAPLAEVNNVTFDPGFLSSLGVLNFSSSEIEIRANNTFIRKDRGAVVRVSDGTWTLTNNQLVLSHNSSDPEETYTLDQTAGTLTGTPMSGVLPAEDEEGTVVGISGRFTNIFEKRD